MKRAIAYTRVSTKEQAESNMSLGNQLEAIKRYCNRNDILLVNTFTDAGESAKTMDRPQLIEAINYCQKNYKDIDCLVVYRIDRFARNVHDHSIMRAALRKFNVELKSVNEMTGDTAVEKLQESIMATLAQFDNDLRAERTKEGMGRRIHEGSWPYPAPLGYINFRDDMQRPTLIPSEVAPIISSLFRDFIRGGMNIQVLTQEAYVRGLRTKKGKKIPHQSVAHMLRNPVYAGYTYTNAKDGPRTLIEGLHEGLIGKDEYYAIQDILDGKKRKLTPSGNEVWPLRGGFIKCSKCNTGLTSSTPTGRKGVRYQFYSCPKCKAKEVGHSVNVAREVLHEQFEELLNSIQPTETHTKVFRKVFLSKWHAAHIQMIKEQKYYEAEIMKLKDRKTRVLTMYIDGKLTDVEKENQTQYIESALVNLGSKLAEVTGQADDAEAVVDSGLRMIKDINKFWRSASIVNQIRFQNTIFPEGLTYDFENGFRTAKINDLYQLISHVGENNDNLVSRAGIEPTSAP